MLCMPAREPHTVAADRLQDVLQASKGVEKKGAKLLSIEASASVKAAQAEARQEAKAAEKRKRQEEKQAQKAEFKRYADGVL